MYYLSLPEMFIEPSSEKDHVLVYRRRNGKLDGIPVLVFCPPNILKVMKEMAKSNTHNEWDLVYVQTYLKRHT